MDAIDELAGLLRASERTLIFTGAGIITPTDRGLLAFV